MSSRRSVGFSLVGRLALRGCVGLGVMGCVTAVGRGVAYGAWWRWFFMDCESGSGASLDAQDVSVGFWLCCGDAVGLGAYRGVRDGLAWVV